MPATMTAPGKAPGSGSHGDDDSSSVLALERKSVQPYRDQDEYLAAMKEDLAEWLNTLYGHNLTVDNFFDELETGMILCEHANHVQSFILERLEEQGHALKPRPGHRPLDLDPERQVAFRSNAKIGSFLCRDNVSNFIAWTHRLGLPDCLLFETEDLVIRKNERSVVLCLLEIARQGARYGMQAPLLVQMEEEIDAEIAAEESAGGDVPAPGPPPPPPRQRIVCDLMSLDEMVREMLGVCTCPDQFPMYRVSEGKYQIGGSRTVIFVRILRKHVMVRIGGGWDTLENYLDRHDPCRCQLKGHRGSRGGRSRDGAAKRRAGALSPNPDVSSSRGGTPEPPKGSRGGTPEPPRGGASSPHMARGAETQDRNKRSQSLTPGLGCSPSNSREMIRSPSPTSDREKSKSTSVRRNLGTTFDMTSRMTTPRKYPAMKKNVSAYQKSGTTQIVVCASDKRQRSQTKPHPNFSVTCEETKGNDEPDGFNREMSKHNSCRDECGVLNSSNTSQCTPDISKRGRSSERTTTSYPIPRGRSLERSEPSANDRKRSQEKSHFPVASSRGRSVEQNNIPSAGGRSKEHVRNMNNRGRVQDRAASTSAGLKGKGVRSRSLGGEDVKRRPLKSSSTTVNRNANDTLIIQRNNGGKHTLASHQRNVTGKSYGKDTSLSILPNKPRIMGRSNTIDDPESYDGKVAQAQTMLRSSSSVSLNSVAYNDYPEPEADATMNERMELLFEEYRKIELGLITKELNAMTNAANNEAADQPNSLPIKGTRTPKTEDKSVICTANTEEKKQIPQHSQTSNRPHLANGKGPRNQTSPSDDSKLRNTTPSINRRSSRGMSPVPMSRTPSPAPMRGRSPIPMSRPPSPAPMRSRSPTPRSRDPSPHSMPKRRNSASDHKKRHIESAAMTKQDNNRHPSVTRCHSTTSITSNKSCMNNSEAKPTSSTQPARVERTSNSTCKHAVPQSGSANCSTPAETPAPTPSLDESVEQWPKIDILSDVPSDEYKEREARVMAYVDSVRKSMNDTSRSGTSLKPSGSGTGPRSMVQQTSNPTRPVSAPSRQRRDSAPATTAEVNKSRNITRGQCPTQSKLKTTNNQSKEDIYKTASRKFQHNTTQNESTRSRRTSTAADKILSSTVGCSSATCKENDGKLREGFNLRQSRSNSCNPPSKRRGSVSNIPDATSSNPPKQSSCSQSVNSSRRNSPTNCQPSTQDQAAQTVECDVPVRPSDLLLNVDTPKTNARRAKTGGRTRIPMPTSSRSDRKEFNSQPLRRYDSGVDINNMSPTEASLQGDDPWSTEDGLLANDHIGYHMSDSEEYF